MMALVELECKECGCRCMQNGDESLTPVAQHDGVSGELTELIRKAQSHMLRTPEADAISVKLTQYLLNAGA